jgi:hypothetical protein
MLRRIGLLAAALACAATAASAQEYVFARIPWNAPVDSVRARLEAQGYAYGGVVGSGDRTFRRDDGASVTVVVRTDRAVGYYAFDGAAGAEVDGRFRVLADSLEAAFGAPLDRRPDLRVWEAGLTSAAVVLVDSGASGGRRVQTEWRGPGWFDEMGRRGALLNLAALPAGYTTVSMNAASRVSVDTATMAARAGRPLRARFRIDHAQAVVDAGERFDAIEYGMDFDCAGGRTRLVSRTTFMGGVRKRSDSAEGLPWAAARAGTDASRGLDAVCRVAGRGPAVVAEPAQRRSFAAIPAGWMVVSQGDADRWLLDPASVRAKAGSVYAATVRVETGIAQPSPYGRMDGMRMQFDVDCAANRTRVTGAAAQLQGRDVGTVPVPPQQAAWSPPGDGNLVIAAVCGIAAQRRP